MPVSFPSARFCVRCPLVCLSQVALSNISIEIGTPYLIELKPSSILGASPRFQTPDFDIHFPYLRCIQPRSCLGVNLDRLCQDVTQPVHGSRIDSSANAMLGARTRYWRYWSWPSLAILSDMHRQETNLHDVSKVTDEGLVVGLRGEASSINSCKQNNFSAIQHFSR